MFDQIELGREFFEMLTAIDEAMLARVRAAKCPVCKGPLHRGDFGRKPRGGAIGWAAEAFTTRFSLCCGREGCRRRATPPSVRFLGRRVYVGAVVIIASMIAQAATSASAAQRATGISARTTRRWLRWWRGPFVASHVFATLSAVLMGIERAALPTSLIMRMASSPTTRVQRLLGWLAPFSATSTLDGSRLVRGLV